MNEQTLNALYDLAAKLGTTVEYLWGVLIAAQRVHVVTNTLELVINLALVAIGVRYFKITYKTWQAAEAPIYGDNMGKAVAVWAVVFLIMVGVVSSWIALRAAIYNLIAPEYMALKELTGMF